MPVYELSLLYKVIPKAELSEALKRVGAALIDSGVALQKLENHGTKDLPYKFVRNEGHIPKGSHYVYRFHGSTRVFKEISDVCKREVDLLRFGFVFMHQDPVEGCTLEEELLPPAHRPSVKKLLETSKRHKWKTQPWFPFNQTKHTFYHMYQ